MMGTRYPAGLRPRAERETVTIDYADVLRQAVENERWRVLRDIRARVERIRTTQASSRSYGSDDRRGDEVKRDVLSALDAAEEALS